MPFKSEAQRRYLWANEPKIAERWQKTYGGVDAPKKALRQKALKARINRGSRKASNG